MTIEMLAAVPWYGWIGLVALAGLMVWQYERVVVLISAALGRHVSPRGADDTVMWRAGDVFASGLSVPIVIIDYRLRVRVYNRCAEDLTGYPFHAINERSFGLMLSEREGDAFKGDLDRYLKDFRDGDATQWVAEERDMVILRQDESALPVKAILTHFGNGHGGIQMELKAAI